jgi:hypothetical protein
MKLAFHSQLHSQATCLEEKPCLCAETQMSTKILLGSVRSHPLKSHAHLSTTHTVSISLRTPPLPCARIAAAPTSLVLRLRHCRSAWRLPPSSLPGHRSPSRATHSTSSCCCRRGTATPHC